MARKIDESKPLSKKDRQWLTDWGKFDVIERIDAQHSPQREAEDEPEPEPEDADPFAEDEDKPTPEDNHNYDDWTNDELRDELAERELSKSGSKAELVARLLEDDLP